jgi:hypothetical protein
MKINPVDRDMRSVLRDGFYDIPRFQRPYSWTNQEVDDFLEDVVVHSGPDYFVGSMVVYVTGKESFAVVDGQQRLTTMTMMLAALRDVADAIGEHSTARGLQKLIEREDDDDQLRYILRPESSHPFFQATVQRFQQSHDEDGPKKSAPAPRPTTPEHRAIDEAFKRITAYVRAPIELILADQSVGRTAGKRAALDRLKEMRDKVLAIRLIFIQLDDEDDAYFIFETLNTRGKDLRVSDLVRNHLLAKIPRDNASLDLPREQWTGLLERFAEAPSDADVNRFILHQWLTRYRYTSDKKLFRDIRKEITSGGDAKSYLDQLTNDADLYRKATEPSRAPWSTQHSEVRDALRALELFGVRQPMPMVLSLLRAHKEKGIKLAALKRTLRTLESFYFVSTAIASVPSSGGVSSMFARFARELTAADTAQRKSDVLKEMTDKLRSMRPTEDQFVAGFVDLETSKRYPQERRVVAYVLRRVYQHHDSTAWDFDSGMNVEHLAPQAGELSDESVANIGNLMLVSVDLNDELADKDFAEKQKILKAQVKVWVDETVLKASEWDEAAIDARARTIAKEAYAKVWAW